ncbi:hypothetical protein RBU55_01010 [Pseudomonas chlororaphis subsp. aurantiaca]|uniref:hypothetical protein n=1 Tax=Pseudomonas chlororaphis TaxID=587753 RepID=UPI0027DC2326|nr:hypothetical protein [Pseudomonas chlororaphis]WMJ00164.1 hypothetical protein RBU55_01010 [Pseudomonas chlororaphis subsp. aurantiaca]
MTRIAITVASTLSLAGCVTQLPESDYQNIATRVAQASICKREQLMSVDQFNHYVVFQTQGYPSQYLYDQAKLGNMVQASLAQAGATVVGEADRPVMEMTCANLATVADRVGARVRHTGVEPQSPVYTPQTTNCITNYGYTTCSTY